MKNTPSVDECQCLISQGMKDFNHDGGPASSHGISKWAKARPSKRPPVFLIDVNIDGVQLFKNSVKSQAYPILGRVHSIDGVTIPIHRSPPFLIGMFHGAGKEEVGINLDFSPFSQAYASPTFYRHSQPGCFFA